MIMVLLDSNILIDYYKSRTSELAEKIDSMQIAVCGIVKSEVLHGARDDEEFDKILNSLKTFELFVIDEYDYEMVGLLINTLRRNGIQVPLPDAIIAFEAMKYDAELWTNDKHFKLIQSVYPELKLVEGEN